MSHKPKKHFEVSPEESRCRQPGSTKNMTKDTNELGCGNCKTLLEKDGKHKSVPS